MTLATQAEWLEAPWITDPAEARTWARLEVRVGDVLVSELLDTRARSVRNGPYCCALPIAEWIADCWPRLVGERRVPAKGGDEWREWQGFHSLRAARQRGALPDLWFRRFDDESFELRVEADGPDLAPGISVRFLTSYCARVAKPDVERALASFVEGVLSRLEDFDDPRVDRLRDRWSTASSHVARVAGRLGVDDETLDSDGRQALESLATDPHREALLAIAEAASGSWQSRLQQARLASGELPPAPPISQQWADLERELRSDRRERPWHTGWLAAGHLRAVLGMARDESPAPCFEQWLEQRDVSTTLRHRPGGFY
ncbi:MAG: hypothetical protein ACOX6T_02765 [Myxococcales bacterium]